MFLNHQASEKKKMENTEKMTHYKFNSTSPNNNLIDEANIITNTKNINSLTEKTDSNFVKHFSIKILKNKNDDLNLNKHLIDTKSSDILFNQNYNSNEYKTIDVQNKAKKNKKVKDINNDNVNYKNKSPNLITLNKDELYNAFILFQNLIKEENERTNDIEYIKNRLFEFVLKRISGNDDNMCENDDIFELQSYRRLLCKSEKLLNIYKNSFDFVEENDINLIRNYSYSFNINNKNKILYNNTKDSIKSSSQIFNEYLLINSKLKDKTITPENSKSFHHNYSFDLKNRDKNESSSYSNRNKDKDNNNYLENENNDAIKYYNSYNYENYNSYRKELEYKSPFDDKNYKNKVLDNGTRKYSFAEDLLIEPFSQKNRKIKILDYNEKEEENIDNYLPNNHSIKENIIISPVKSIMNTQKFNNINNIESQQTEKIIHEIRVNKNKYLNNKEQIINEKVKELNEEIRKFREERNKVTMLKEEYLKLKANLNKEIKDFNMKKEINKKYYKNEFDKMRNFPQNESKLIMTLSQHNQSLILNNNKKRDTIRLLRQRIFELENIIKAKNEQRTNYKNIFRKIYNKFEKHYENINIFTKKKINKKKKNNDSYMLKKARINLKKNIESNSLEKMKGNEKINQTMNNNVNINNNNMNKIYFDSNVNKNISKIYDKKIMNISYNHPNIKNNILNSKLVNSTNVSNCFTKCSNNVNSNRILIKKNLSNNMNITGLNSRNNSINVPIVNNKKNDNEVYHTNLYIYEKLIKKEREKDKEYKKININLNLERDLDAQRKIIKELKTEILEKNKSEKDKKHNKNIIKKCQRSQGKNLLINRLELKDDIKIKNNMSILSSYKMKQKNNSINKKNISAIRPLKRNATNLFKIEKLNNDVKKINNSLDTKDINKNLKTTNNKINQNNSLNIIDDENELEYDFVIPKKYKMNNGEIINTIDSDGKIINIYNNNKKEIIFKSGVRKEIFMDGYQLVHFPNGDLKQKFFGKDEKVIYYYNETNTVQTTFKSGLNIFKFSNGQIEKHYPDGSKYIIYTNGIKRKISKNGKEEMIVPNEGKNKEKKCYNSIENDNDNNDITNENDVNEGKKSKLPFLDIENENKSD